MKNLLKWLDVNLEPLLMTIIFYLMMSLVTVQVILRFVFHSGFAWGEEIARFIFVWLCFVSIGYISRNGRHIGVDFIRELFPTIVRRLVLITVDVLTLAVLVLLLKGSIDIMQSVSLFGDRGLTANISMNWLHGAAVVGYTLMCLRTLQSLVWKIRRFNSSYDLFRNDGGQYSGANNIFFTPLKQKEELDLTLDRTVLLEENQRKAGGKR